MFVEVILHKYCSGLNLRKLSGIIIPEDVYYYLITGANLVLVVGTEEMIKHVSEGSVIYFIFNSEYIATCMRHYRQGSDW
jgi:hypothetical protein